jgi:hypothetical protein
MDGSLVYQLSRPGQMLGSHIRSGEALTASKRETHPKMRCPGGRDPRETPGRPPGR